MLEAERAMGIGLLDNAERLYAQVVAIDPKNSIAVTGLARVALERGDQRGAYTFARRAVALDPDNPMASHLWQRMAEQMRNRGEALPDDPVPEPAESAPGEPASASTSATTPAPAAAAPAASPAAVPPADDGLPESASTARPGLVDRFLRRRR